MSNSNSSSKSSQDDSEYDSQDDSEYDSQDCSSSSDEIVEQFDNLDLQGGILNKYNVLYEIGKGADAIVWLAFNIEDSKFYAIKVNEPKEFKKGVDEFNFIKKLPLKLKCFNHLKESFNEIIQDQDGKTKKYSCGVFELHTGNLDCLLRKGKYQDGLTVEQVKKIMYQLLTSLKYLHQKMKIYHADIKTDNILLRGYNDFDEKMMEQYLKLDFMKNYTDAKNAIWLEKGQTLDSIDNMKKEEKLKIRKVVHKVLCEKLQYPNKEEKYNVNPNYVDKCYISLSDFGAFCNEDEHYDEEFGTRYYRAPEIILMGNCGYPVDIWSAGCVFYELLTGRILFDPEKDSIRTRDAYHLYHINRHMGDFPIGFLKKTKHWKQYFDINGKLNNFEIEKREFKDKLTSFGVTENQEDILSLLKGMLSISPNQRMSAEQCLRHSFFNGISM